MRHLCGRRGGVRISGRSPRRKSGWLADSLVRTGAPKRSVAELRPVGLVPSLQKVVARPLIESALEYLLPQHMNANAFRRRSDITLVLCPLRLWVEKKRDTGQSPSLLQVGLKMTASVQCVSTWLGKPSRIAWARGARFPCTGLFPAPKPRSARADRWTPIGATSASVADRVRLRCRCCWSAS